MNRYRIVGHTVFNKNCPYIMRSLDALFWDLLKVRARVAFYTHTHNGFENNSSLRQLASRCTWNVEQSNRRDSDIFDRSIHRCTVLCDTKSCHKWKLASQNNIEHRDNIKRWNSQQRICQINKPTYTEWCRIDVSWLWQAGINIDNTNTHCYSMKSIYKS